MGEEFYSVIKLVSGEEIFSLISIDENDGDPIVILQNPIVIKTIKSPYGGSYVKVKPWMELANDDFYVIKLNKIMTMTEIKNSPLIEIYNKYLTDDEDNEIYEDNNQTKITDKMGYISSVEDARKKLEKLFKNIKEN